MFRRRYFHKRCSSSEATRRLILRYADSAPRMRQKRVGLLPRRTLSIIFESREDLENSPRCSNTIIASISRPESSASTTSTDNSEVELLKNEAAISNYQLEPEGEPLKTNSTISIMHTETIESDEIPGYFVSEQSSSSSIGTNSTTATGKSKAQQKKVEKLFIQVKRELGHLETISTTSIVDTGTMESNPTPANIPFFLFEKSSSSSIDANITTSNVKPVVKLKRKFGKLNIQQNLGPGSLETKNTIIIMNTETMESNARDSNSAHLSPEKSCYSSNDTNITTTTGKSRVQSKKEEKLNNQIILEQGPLATESTSRMKSNARPANIAHSSSEQASCSSNDTNSTPKDQLMKAKKFDNQVELELSLLATSTIKKKTMKSNVRPASSASYFPSKKPSTSSYIPKGTSYTGESQVQLKKIEKSNGQLKVGSLVFDTTRAYNIREPVFRFLGTNQPVPNFRKKRKYKTKQKAKKIVQKRKQREEERQVLDLQRERDDFKKWLARKKMEEQLEMEKEKLKEIQKLKEKIDDIVNYNVWQQHKKIGELEAELRQTAVPMTEKLEDIPRISKKEDNF